MPRREEITGLAFPLHTDTSLELWDQGVERLEGSPAQDVPSPYSWVIQRHEESSPLTVSSANRYGIAWMRVWRRTCG